MSTFSPDASTSPAPSAGPVWAVEVLQVVVYDFKK